MATRYDVGTLKPAQKRADGRLIVDAHLTRSGVFTYRNNDGTTRREYRPPEEVFKKDSLETASMMPITNNHPSEPVTSRNARKYAVGSVGEAVRRDGDHVAAPLVVFEDKTIAEMDAGKRDVSCGYECDLDETPGVTPQGERYDAVQRNIVYNHLAIVSVGRAGSARVRMDGAVQQLDGAESASDLPTKDITMDDLKKALADAATAAARADAAEKALGEAKKELDATKARLDSVSEELAAEKKIRTDAAAALPALVKTRVALETKAGPLLGREFKTDGLSDREIRCAVIEKVTGNKLGADRSDDYVTARYDAAIERAELSANVLSGQAELVVAGRVDAATGPGAPGSAAAARAEMIKRNAALNTIEAAVAAGK